MGILHKAWNISRRTFSDSCGISCGDFKESVILIACPELHEVLYGVLNVIAEPLKFRNSAYKGKSRDPVKRNIYIYCPL
jgi:hypothetical protein